jgi:hypothetical protein
MDGVDAFHAAYARGKLTSAPREYLELVLVPSILHTTWETFSRYPPMIQHLTITLLMSYIGAGQLSLETIHGAK